VGRTPAGWAHPVGTAGPYRVPTRLARLLKVRAPRCEWPGCGHRAAGCDLDHDQPWPAGPTCGCNLGPLCRRHHRLKHALLAKHRTPGNNVRWTSPTGRSWTAPSQHTAPQTARRPAPPVAPRHPEDPRHPEHPRHPEDPWNPEDDLDLNLEMHLDPAFDVLRADDHDQDDPPDDIDQRLADNWGLTLTDPTPWHH